MNEKDVRDARSQGTVVVLATSFGVAAGAAVGAVAGNVAPWVSIGICLGAAAGYVLVWKRSKERQ